MINCQPATTGDAAAIRALTIAFDRGAETQLEQADFETRYAEIAGSPDWLLAIAELDGEPVGYVLAQDYGPGLRRPFTVGRLHDTYVLPSARRKGVARAMMAVVEEWARTRGRPMILDWQSTPEAISFYESLGYVSDTEGDFAENPMFTLDTRRARS